jgi:tRNA 2-(methylsulfanyl)-N6-isopentenyladenosine37 hydroxylase
MLKRLDTEIQTLIDFLKIKTPNAWLRYASHHIPLLLVDHAHCERKAAATAISFINKYPERAELVEMMSPLAREELLHFEKVLLLLQQRNIAFGPLQPSDYASTMHRFITNKDGQERLCDQLIIGAIIEARSCERFSAIIPYLQDDELAKFYGSLLRAEARHFQGYLRLARLYGEDIDGRIALFLGKENEFICSQDEVFRFHSGIPPTTIT